jgi:hypothetical protein
MDPTSRWPRTLTELARLILEEANFSWAGVRWLKDSHKVNIGEKIGSSTSVQFLTYQFSRNCSWGFGNTSPCPMSFFWVEFGKVRKRFHRTLRPPNVQKFSSVSDGVTGDGISMAFNHVSSMGFNFINILRYFNPISIHFEIFQSFFPI